MVVSLLSGISTSFLEALEQSIAWYWASSNNRISFFLDEGEGEEESDVEGIPYALFVLLRLHDD